MTGRKQNSVGDRVLMIIVLLCMSFTSSFDEDEMEGVS